MAKISLANLSTADRAALLASLLGGDDDEATEKNTKSKGKGKVQLSDDEKEDRKWYDDIEGTEREVSAGAPADLVAKRTEVMEDKTIGENLRAMALAGVDAKIKEASRSCVMVLQRMRDAKRTAKTRYTRRCKISDGTREITIKPHEVALILQHRDAIAQWLHDCRQAGAMED